MMSIGGKITSLLVDHQDEIPTLSILMIRQTFNHRRQSITLEEEKNQVYRRIALRDK